MSETSVRDRILEVATSLFAERGYGSTSVREVAEAAEVTKPTLYYYFQDKEALFLEAVRNQTEQLRSLVELGVRSPGNVRARLHAFISVYLAFVRENASGMKLLMTVHYRPEDGQPSVDILSVHRKNGEILGRLLEEGIREGEVREGIQIMDAVMALVGMLNLRCSAALHGPPLDDDIADRILDLFFHGIGN